MDSQEAPKRTTGSDKDSDSSGAQDKLAAFFQYLEKNPNDAYNKDFDGRHAKLNDLTPEFRPFLREVMMRQELRGRNPKIFQTKRTEEEERGHIANGTSSLHNASDSKHIDLGRGADAADVADASVAWGPPQPEKGQQLSPQDLIKKQQADAYFKDQQQSFKETKKRWGDKADHFNWGGDWHSPYDPAHIENSERVLPDNKQ